MRVSAKATIPLVRAQQIIRDLCIETPDEIEVELIAAHHGAPVRTVPMQGADGRMVRLGVHGLISVRDNIRYVGQRRFVIAHELGHFLLHPHVRQIDEIKATQSRNWSLNQAPEEIEANTFAAELLMPRTLFEPKLRGQEPGFPLIKALADEFNTTLTATAIQFLRYTPEECAFACYNGPRRQWVTRSSGWEFTLRDDTHAHPFSCVAEVMEKGLSGLRAADVPAGAWLADYAPDAKDAYLTEEVMRAGDGAQCFVLLWIHDAI